MKAEDDIGTFVELKSVNPEEDFSGMFKMLQVPTSETDFISGLKVQQDHEPLVFAVRRDQPKAKRNRESELVVE